LEYSLPFNILFGIALSSILSTCPNHLILCDLIDLTIFVRYILPNKRDGTNLGKQRKVFEPLK
jgi:hypothetical protein